MRFYAVWSFDEDRTSGDSTLLEAPGEVFTLFSSLRGMGRRTVVYKTYVAVQA